ncbi:DNA polymerase III subunit gamma and tau [Arcanobacterium phocisimile]|uniref:DNA-directed DNA polymerase n=2 Tax=Arcanobacterium phocisimile TaxID=1302235 RepID=A0ABX7IG44_9ACTO|nr:DNA polymerase III subunit gamma and tau [Arcanobacterium phocisimile]QRV02032.1 DNA polymerase III subunit gamma and tau [Arcanobacterium phocisimile]
MSVAMYRRYRPQSFQEVIGQDHVVAPLKAALAAGRTTHAYLFSGPRGCGKTTSARILARCLNCAQYPTDTPCGECESCRDLARDGAGSLDVVEMDAASHGGVDDARELREQAGFAPVRDRFKIFIIDEAHMVSNQGFNALLKLVEEPPEHVKFIFATTEPDKVIGTIRSRTHHYPFRLVPPLDLEKYLARLCAMEGVSASKDVLNLVIRAGTGSVRDTLSVLDQIIGGSDSHSLDYERAVALLGYTSAHLLDDAVSAVAIRDGAALFSVVDSVVKSGHDPRRFVEDLLQRLRDVVIIALTGESSRDVFVSVPDDQYERMSEQAQALGTARASRCADITNEALNMMVGATSPRLQLELLCARLVVAQAEGTHTGKTGAGSAETEGGQVSSPPPALAKWKKPATPQLAQPTEPAASAAMPAHPVVEQQPTTPVTPPADQVVAATAPAVTRPVTSAVSQAAAVTSPAPQAERVPQAERAPEVPRATPGPVPENEPYIPPRAPRDLPDSATVQARVATSGPASALFDKISGAWADIVSHPHLGGLVRNQLNAGARPLSIEDNTLKIAFAMPAVAQRFNQRNSGEHVADVLREVLNIEVAVIAVPDEGVAYPKAEAALEQTPSTVQEYAADIENDDENEATAGVENPPTELSAVEDSAAELDVDPAGVLSTILDRTVHMLGDDHIAAHRTSAEGDILSPAGQVQGQSKTTTEKAQPEPVPAQQVPHAPVSPAPMSPVPKATPEEPPKGQSPAENDFRSNVNSDIPFFAESMPEIPPLEYPGDDYIPAPAPNTDVSTSWMQHSTAAPAIGRDINNQPDPAELEQDFPGVSPTYADPASASAQNSAGATTKHDQSWEIHPPQKPQTETVPDWEEVSDDDPDISESTLVGIRVLMDTFNAKVIDEIPDSHGGM